MHNDVYIGEYFPYDVKIKKFWPHSKFFAFLSINLFKIN
jgi:hypothetical protein